MHVHTCSRIRVLVLTDYSSSILKHVKWIDRLGAPVLNPKQHLHQSDEVRNRPSSFQNLPDQHILT